ncbi:uncharacterized protein Z518_05610 [Rhinocladiella mackenziei CBS 650.93]|uniref:Rhinocladiella mackenziei CBS 650.93 unplaced genomic scaffold supercont1.4, whole genome shotgun sequence n=1 Tax=Rhinocladiella mackenziei CBS 650.93 TaxID=1442369 RepID=A0A0D2J6Q3_9EURO|nr:uncharacterized protein Z518_05610 [Rhinocladiella mackenziei CBS 650.93]KIX04740.1 hypothetical protein Z518_05610 [Rhinocladiella mackenziei CBS 650.93]
MPEKSHCTVPIPYTSLPSFIFGSDHGDVSHDPAYIDCDSQETLSFHDFREYSLKFAAGLRANGLQPSGRVLLFSGNDMYFPVIFMGVVMAGGIFSTSNPSFTARELAQQLRDCQPQFVLAADPSVALEAVGLAGLKCEVVSLDDWKKFLGAEDNNLFPSSEEENPRRTILLLYSSGTTGFPKGVELSHYNLVANCCQLEHNVQTPQRWLCFLPLYHGLALLHFTTLAPYLKIPVYIMKRYNLPKMVENTRKFRITELLLVPPIAISLVKYPVKDLPVRRIISAAAPLSREVCEQLEKLWPVKVEQAWGMTEAASLTIGNGQLMPNCEAKLMDGVEEGRKGELWIRAPNIMNGYWRNPKSTEEVLTPDGWLKTGDIAYTDQGKYYIVDRIKELIKVKGNQVAPAELEALILEHPHVADAAVIGAKIDDDERPRAYVVPKKGVSLTQQDILKFVNGKVSKIKWITGGVVFTDTIPKTPVSPSATEIAIHG